jgi:dienelactone hydrolase
VFALSFLPSLALFLLSAAPPERLRGEGSDRRPTPLGKALAVALRQEAQAEVSLIPGSVLRADADPADPTSIPRSVPPEPCVVGRATGSAIARALAASASRAGPYLQTSGLLFDEGDLDAGDVRVGRFPLEAARSYRVACAGPLAGPLGLDPDAAPVPDLRTLAVRRLRVPPPPPFPPPPAAAPIERRLLGSGTRLGIERLLFPTALPSGFPENDRVPLTLFRPARGNGAGVLILPIWKGRDARIEEMMARRLAEEGFLAATMPLAFQYERAAPGVPSGDWTLSADVPRTRAALLQSVEDARRAGDLLLAEGIAPERLAVLGASMGGHVASAVYSVDERFRAGAFLLAGGDVAGSIWRASRETAGIKAALVRAGVTREALEESFRPFDPATYATAARREGVFLVGALHDPVIPPENVEILWSAYGEPRLLWISADHYSGILFLPSLLGEVAEHFRRVLDLPPRR